MNGIVVLDTSATRALGAERLAHLAKTRPCAVPAPVIQELLLQYKQPRQRSFVQPVLAVIGSLNSCVRVLPEAGEWFRTCFDSPGIRPGSEAIWRDLACRAGRRVPWNDLLARWDGAHRACLLGESYLNVVEDKRTDSVVEGFRRHAERVKALVHAAFEQHKVLERDLPKRRREFWADDPYRRIIRAWFVNQAAAIAGRPAAVKHFETMPGNTTDALQVLDAVDAHHYGRLDLACELLASAFAKWHEDQLGIDRNDYYDILIASYVGPGDVLVTEERRWRNLAGDNQVLSVRQLSAHPGDRCPEKA